MRTILALIIIGLSVPLLLAGDEVTINLDRIALLTPDQNSRDTCVNRVAVGFSFPEELTINEVFFAELVFDLDFTGVGVNGGPLLEFQVYGITSAWDEENVGWNTWDRAGGDIDTLNYFTYSVTMADTAGIYMDVTPVVKSIVEDGKSNNGLMIIPLKRGEGVFNISEAIASYILNNAQLKIKYR